MQPVIIELPNHTRGDRWWGMHIGPILFGTDPPPRPLVSCRLYFRRPNGRIGYKFKSDPSTGDGTINVINAVTWELDIPEQSLPLDLGLWEWDFEVTDLVNQPPLTIYSGTIIITREQTYD